MCEEYNGYANYETWNVSLWLDNDYSAYTRWQERIEELRGDFPEDAIADVLAQDLEISITEATPETTGMYADLLNAALSTVDWREIADVMLSA